MTISNVGLWRTIPSVHFSHRDIIVILLGATVLTSIPSFGYAACVPGRTINCQILVSGTSIYDVGVSGTVSTVAQTSIHVTTSDALDLSGNGVTIYSDDNNTPITSTNGNGLNASVLRNTDVVASYLLLEGGGNISGSLDGIHTNNFGQGDSTVRVSGTVTGQVNGIHVSNGGGLGDEPVTDITSAPTFTPTNYIHGGAGLFIKTGTGKVTGDLNGIAAYNRGTGSTKLTVDGEVEGIRGNGISVINREETGGIQLNTTQKVSGGVNAIFTQNNGSNISEITTGGDIEGRGGHGIFALEGPASPGVLIMNLGKVRAKNNGIGILNYGMGYSSIAARGEIEAGDTGLSVDVGLNATSVSIMNYETVTGKKHGISTVNNGIDTTYIVADADVKGETGAGIHAFAADTAGDLTIIVYDKVTGGEFGINAENLGSGSLNINAFSGHISGAKVGIKTIDKAKGTTTITSNGLIEGTQTGLSAESTDGRLISITNSRYGEIRNQTMNWDDLAVQTRNGATVIVNNNLITGKVDLGLFNDKFNNAGTWQTLGLNNFGQGDDTFINENMVITSNSANPETTTFSGLETFVNRGVLKLTDSVAGDRTIISGNYVGESGSIVEIDTELGDDNSLTDQLVIEGSSSGNSDLLVNSLLGNGQPTVEGIKVIDVKGGSAAVFSLSESSPNSYLHDGQRAMVSGAFAYKLYKDAASVSDGDWYLRSQLKTPPPLGDDPDPEPPIVDPEPPVVDPEPPIVDPEPPVVDPEPPVVDPEPPVVDPEPPVVDPKPQPPLYQAGTPIYETYGQNLQALNSISTLKQRVGNRHWSEGKSGREDKTNSRIDAQAIWARIEGSHARVSPKTSTTSANYDSDVWRIQSGVDGVLLEGDAGILFGGITAHYGTVSTNITSAHGNGDIDTTGYGLGANLTWYGTNGFYIDSQAQATWYDSDLNSDTANRNLVRNNDGFGYSLSIEAGKRIEIDQQWRITPQAQLVYSDVDFDSFTDPFGARVRLENGDSLKGRIGVAAEYENTWRDESGKAVHTNLYGIANLYYEFLEGIRTDVAGTRFTSQNERLMGGLGLGGDYTWQDGKYAIYGEVSVITSLAHFGDSYSLNGTTGFKVRW